MTAAGALRWGAERLAGAGLTEGRREARLLLRAFGGIDGWLKPEEELPPDVDRAFRAAVERRARREPFAYVVGVREFRALDLEVGPGVLIPRPETELVVERALARAASARPALAADLCTGSGAIALALANACPDLAVLAADLSRDALAVAARNVARHELGSRVRLLCGDLWGALPPGLCGSLDLCTCNPPYVDAGEVDGLEPEVRDWEPRIALVAEEGWRSIYGRLAAGAALWLRPGGWLIVEVGKGQAPEVAGIFAAHNLADIAAHADLAGTARVVEGRRIA